MTSKTVQTFCEGLRLTTFSIKRNSGGVNWYHKQKCVQKEINPTEKNPFYVFEIRIETQGLKMARIPEKEQKRVARKRFYFHLFDWNGIWSVQLLGIPLKINVKGYPSGMYRERTLKECNLLLHSE